MLRCCRVWANYQRGSWCAGSKHQKHMMLNPTLFLYRFPGPREPGPYTMKYWWTLGCFPTGLSTPFRLQEFLASYQQAHVPAEVEEWLGCFVRQPVAELRTAVHALRNKLEQMPLPEQTRGYTALGASLTPCLPQLKKMEEQLGVAIPAVGLRAAMQTPKLRMQLLEDLYDYEEALVEGGSTPHRRLGIERVLPQSSSGSNNNTISTATPAMLSDEGVSNNSNDNTTTSTNTTLISSSSSSASKEDTPAACSSTTTTTTMSTSSAASDSTTKSESSPVCSAKADQDSEVSAVSDPSAAAMRTALTPPPTTARDERALLRLCTTVAEACVVRARPNAAHALLSATLFLAQDDLTRSVVHGNTACAALLEGDFAEAAFHAREAALLVPSTSCASEGLTGNSEEKLRPAALRSTLERRSYALWATAVAYQEDYDAALHITRDALALFPQDEPLVKLQNKLEALQASAQSVSTLRPAAWRGRRLHTATQRRRGLERGAGCLFDNEFDWVVFNHKLYPSKMDPRTNEMGSVFRRVGDLGGRISTSRAMEPL